MPDFEKAVNVAAAAAFIDDHKPTHLGHQRHEAEQHVEFLHAFAQELAGDRVLEIYPEEE